MDWLTFISKLAEHLAWPGLIFGILYTFRESLKDPLIKLVDRILEWNKDGIKFAPPHQSISTPIKDIELNPEHVPEDEFNLLPPLIEGMEAGFRTLNLQNDTAKLGMLVRLHAEYTLKAQWFYINLIIYGSQIKALETMSMLESLGEQISKTVIQTFYIKVCEDSPEFAKASTFEQYLSYLQHSTKLIEIDNSERDDNDLYFKLSDYGKGFLAWRNIPENKTKRLY